MRFDVLNLCNVAKTEPNVEQISRLDADLTYEDFFQGYMQPNVPCIIKNVTNSWSATSLWVNDSSPNLNYLKNKYGTCNVTIYHCNQKYFNSQKTETCNFAAFVDKWDSHDSKHKYLKDWHLKNTSDDDFYQVPIYFASDWLNEFLTAKNRDDYRFVYMGRQGTWTPFHADVFNSFSWSANVCGRKKWVLFPPGEEDKMTDSLNNLPYDIKDYDNFKHFEVVQNAGEAIFVPSGWHHQVWNLADTISVNHNWVNGCNIDKMWQALDKSLQNVKKEIADCSESDDFPQQCQIMLKALFGLDFQDFYDFLLFICEKRLDQVENKTEMKLFHGHFQGHKHAIFDLNAIKLVYDKFAAHQDFPIIFHSKDNKLEIYLKQMNK